MCVTGCRLVTETRSPCVPRSTRGGAATFSHMPRFFALPSIAAEHMGLSRTATGRKSREAAAGMHGEKRSSGMRRAAEAVSTLSPSTARVVCYAQHYPPSTSKVIFSKSLRALNMFCALLASLTMEPFTTRARSQAGASDEGESASLCSSEEVDRMTVGGSTRGRGRRGGVTSGGRSSARV